mmetsp:Transcript_30585/g.45585  ORF Transcript_30585/g.45585 Transcript_30585/m.45585 type:complete len:98 (-) Transcript_30585:23-316(-)
MDEHGAVRNWVAQDSIYLGYNGSNNQAEYEGLCSGVQYMRDNDIKCDGLYVRGDSEVVIKQLAGLYVVRSNNIIDHYNEAIDLLENSGVCECHHVNT